MNTDAEDEYEFDWVAEKVAKSRGLVVVYPKKNQLQIDLDSEDAYRNFLDQMDALDIRHSWAVITPSASGLPNRHATITFTNGRTFTEWERIAIQFALGSDPVREKLNIMRLYNGLPNPTRLFEKP